MKYFTISFIAIVLIALALGCTAALADDDDRYVGLHITVPFSLDGVGIQVIARHDDAEARAGYDSNGNYQAGVGLGVGESVVYSAGMAYSSYHNYVVPYAGIRADYQNDYEAGAVTYAATKDTSYGFIGFRFNDDGDQDDKTRNSSDNPDGPGDGGGGDNNGGGDSGDGDGSDGDDGGSDDNTKYANNRSGLGDGTNPGNGGGKTNSKNTGTLNPSATKK